MTTAQELFRFVALRRPERLLMHRINTLMIRDRRDLPAGSLFHKLMGPGEYSAKLRRANGFANDPDFVKSDDVTILLLDRAADFFRATLTPGLALTDLKSQFEQQLPLLAGLLKVTPEQALVTSTVAFTARLWDSLYAQIIRGCDVYTSTNYLADALRVYHVLRIGWLLAKLRIASWIGSKFDDYEILIDLQKAHAQQPSNDDDKHDFEHHDWPLDKGRLDGLEQAANQLVSIDDARVRLDDLVSGGAIQVTPQSGNSAVLLNERAVKELHTHPAFKGTDLANTPVNELARELQTRRQLASSQFRQLQSVPLDVQASDLLQNTMNDVLAKYSPPQAKKSTSPLNGFGGHFFVPLAVGDLQPPVVGDLLLVEQHLQRYEMREIADIENVLKGERKERSSRNLSRTSQTTTTEQSSEREESESLKTDERFQLSTEAQKAASQTFSVDVGINVSGKFGPVQVGVSANASFSASKSSSDSTSQEYAKTVTEEATKRVKESFKQTSSVTLLTESLTTSLHGVNNEKGADHIVGIYRWVDKIYVARTMNYGRRLMLRFMVPEPASFFRSLMNQELSELTEGLIEPIHPSLIDKDTFKPIADGDTSRGFNEFTDIDEDNYAELAALYDVTDIAPPPLPVITGAKALVYPEAHQAAEIKDHDTEANELGLVMADNTLTIDPNYELDEIGVFVPEGGNDGLAQYARALKMGTRKNKENRLLLTIGDRSFHFTATGQDDDKIKIVDNFNEMVSAGDTLEGVLQPSLPISVTADFEGVFALNVVYTARLRDEAEDAWKAQTFAAILKGYQIKKQAYDQALAIVTAQVESEKETTTSMLRDDQYRAIETTELKRGCIDLMTRGTAVGHTSIAAGPGGTVRIVFNPAEGATLRRWRSPLANGAVAEFFEQSFAWDQITYQFHPYFWTDKRHWKDLMGMSSGDPIFEQFLKAGTGSVVVPVEPGYERAVLFFLKTGLIWGGGYLPLFTEDDMLEVYSDVEQGVQLDPPQQVGDSWEVRLPTNLIMLQKDSELPTFEVPEVEDESSPATEEPVPDESVPF